MELLIALILGLLFGFILQKTGAANPHRIIGMLRLRDFHILKAVLLAVGISSFLLYLLLPLELIDLSHLSIKPAYLGVALGGGILGLGWALSGFCPNSGLVALGAGRRDALFFVIGGLCGALAYMFMFEFLHDSFIFEPLFTDMLGDKNTLVNFDYGANVGLPLDYRNLAVVGFVASFFVVMAWLLPTIEATDEID